MSRFALSRAQCEAWLLDCALYSLDGLEAGTRWLGRVLVFAAFGIISLFTYTYFVDLLPLQGILGGSLQWWLITVPGLWLLFNVLFNYVICLIRDPGAPQKPSGGEGAAAPPPPRDESSGDSDDEEFLFRGGATAAPRWCRVCDAPKPPRTHHCSVCKKCRLRMDHHCPWINQCVAYNNYGHFLRLLMYLVVGCAFVATVGMRPFLASMEVNASVPYVQGDLLVRLLSRRTRLQMTVVMALALGSALLALLLWNWWLAVTATTGIEVYAARSARKKLQLRGRIWVNQYDLGWRRNLEEVFGTPSWWRWMLPTLSFPPGDGHRFPTRSSPKRRGQVVQSVAGRSAPAPDAGTAAAEPRRRGVQVV